MVAAKEEQVLDRKLAHAAVALAAFAVACAVWVVSEKPGCATLFLASAVSFVVAVHSFSTP